MADLRARIDGEILTLDPDSVTSREYKPIKKHTGLSMYRFWQAVMSTNADTDVEIFDALRWLFLKRGGRTVDLFTDDEYSPADFFLSFMELNSSEDESDEDDPKDSDATPESI